MAPVRLFASLSLFALGLSFSAPASAWSVCNETSYILRFAHASGSVEDHIAKGWTRLRPGQCEELDAPEGQPRFVYAESSKAYPGGVREWRGTTPLCAEPEDFESKPALTCDLQNIGTRPYIAVAQDEDRTALVEPADYGAKAENAGMQRLLIAAGYSVSNVDGNAGSQTRRAMRTFLKDKELSSDLAVDAQVDALEIAALERQGRTGINICNRSSSKIWAAISYRQRSGWMARGWWAVEPEACLRPHVSSIKGLSPHVFALQEKPSEDGKDSEDLILKSNSAEPTAFCIAESRFAASLRENCADRGYRAINFRPLSGEEDGVEVNLTDADFTETAKAGLRR